MFLTQLLSGFSLRILVAGERCNVTGEYFERGSMSGYNIVIGYQTFAGELSIVNRIFSDLWCLMNSLIINYITKISYIVTWWINSTT